MKRALLFLAAIVGSIGLFGLRTTTVGATVVVMPLTALNDECDIRCTHPGDCDPGSHDAWEGSPINATRNGGVHLNYQCFSGTCDNTHGPLCGGPPESPDFASADLEYLRKHLASNDVREAAAVLASHEKQATVNMLRSAVQVVDCTGSVVAHLPVSETMAAALVMHGAAVTATLKRRGL